MSHLTNGRKYAGDFTFNESGAVRHQPNLHLNREGLSRSRCFEMRVMCFFYFHHQWLNYCSIPKTFFLLIVSQFSRKTFLQIFLDIQNQNWILLNQKCLLVFQLDPTMNFLLARNSIFWKLNIKLILQKKLFNTKIREGRKRLAKTCARSIHQ